MKISERRPVLDASYALSWKKWCIGFEMFVKRKQVEKNERKSRVQMGEGGEGALVDVGTDECESE